MRFPNKHDEHVGDSFRLDYLGDVLFFLPPILWALMML